MKELKNLRRDKMRRCKACGKEYSQDREWCECGAKLSGNQEAVDVDLEGQAEPFPTPVVKVEHPNGIIEVSDGEWIGRESTPQIVEHLPEKKALLVSRKHLKIEEDQGKFYLLNPPDLTNFTELNGEKIEKGKRYRIKDGYQVNLAGQVELKVKIESAYQK